MPRPKKPSALMESAEKTAAVLAGVDYGVHPQDFVLYELHRLIEEDRASLDDSEFRTLIDEGIRAHWPGADGKPLEATTTPLHPRRDYGW